LHSPAEAAQEPLEVEPDSHRKPAWQLSAGSVLSVEQKLTDVPFQAAVAVASQQNAIMTASAEDPLFYPRPLFNKNKLPV
jgi:hypothetical protein